VPVNAGGKIRIYVPEALKVHYAYKVMLTGEEYRVSRFLKWVPVGVGLAVLGVVLISVACGTKSSVSTATQMRVVHLAPTEPSLDLLIDNKVVLSSVAYGVPTMETSITAINHDLKLNLAGAPTNVLDSPMEPFAAGTSYTGLIVGDPNSPAGVRLNKLIDDHSAPTAGMFKLRVVNGSPNSGPLDVYVLNPSSPGYATAKPTIGGLASNTPSTYQMLASGSYQIFVTAAGDNSCLLNLPQPPAPPIPDTCLINLNGLHNSSVPAFSAGQNRTLVVLNRVPLVQGAGIYTTLPLLADLN